jgi:hypothetical protein
MPFPLVGNPLLDQVTHLVAGCTLRAVLPARPDGKKLLLPIAPGQDRSALVAGHLAGRLPPVAIRTGDGRTWTERRAVALAACPVVSDQAAWIALDIDAAGHGHATRATAAVTQQSAEVAADLVADMGWPYLVAASGGGAGRHIWCPLSMPAAMAVWVATLWRQQVIERVPGADIEIRPNGSHPPGAPLTLPGGGAYAGAGGGLVLHHSQGRTVALGRLQSAWELKLEADNRQNTRRATMMALKSQGPGPRPAATVHLRDVLAALTEITEERSNGAFRAHCPIHHGNHALTGNLQRRLWRCWVCGRGGAGEAAAYTLAAFLLGDPPARRVFATLAEIGTPHVCA